MPRGDLRCLVSSGTEDIGFTLVVRLFSVHAPNRLDCAAFVRLRNRHFKTQKRSNDLEPAEPRLASNGSSVPASGVRRGAEEEQEGVARAVFPGAAAEIRWSLWFSVKVVVFKNHKPRPKEKSQ